MRIHTRKAEPGSTRFTIGVVLIVVAGALLLSAILSMVTN